MIWPWPSRSTRRARRCSPPCARCPPRTSRSRTRSAACWPRTSSAERDVPSFANSAMDGFAVRSGPAGRALRIVGESRAGAPATVGGRRRRGDPHLDRRRAPRGRRRRAAGRARDASTATRVTLDDDVAPGRNLRPAGDDVRAGETVLTAGTRMGAGRDRHRRRGRPRDRVAARACPRVVGAGHRRRARRARRPAGPGPAAQLQRRDARRAGRRRPARACCAPTPWPTPRRPRARPSPRRSRRPTSLVLSGGVSVGPHDHVKPALQALGVDEVFWRVALRPGRPTWFGTRGDTLVFGLPGNPVSAMVTFMLFARPALGAHAGRPARARADRRPPRRGDPPPPRPRRVRARDRCTTASPTPTGPQGSHQLSSMLGADGFAIVTAGEGARSPGDQVVVELV